MGKTIAREFGDSSERRTLPRWISFRIGELINRIDDEDAEQAEVTKKEVTELILRLWEMREKWPQGGPMHTLEQLAKRTEPSRLGREPVVARDDWPALISALGCYDARDIDLLLDALASQVDLAAEERWILECGRELTEDEKQTFDFYKARQDQLRSSSSHRFKASKNLFEMSATELRAWVKGGLQKNDALRRVAVKTATTNRRQAPPKGAATVPCDVDDE